jgi:methionyl-tRNA formyltransferase
MTLRIIFMGTPDFAVPTLTALIGNGHEVAAVYTREPKPAGRGMALQKSPVHQVAEKFGLPVLTPKTLRTPEALAAFTAHEADVAVVVAYGMILPQAILDAPRLGCLNLHGSLLPRWRGAAPIQRAVMAGDAESGVMVMRMEAGLDTGPVGMVEKCAIPPEMTAQDLHDRLMALGADLMVRAIAALERGTLTFKQQSTEGVTYAAKITKEEARINWHKPAHDVHNHIRGLSPFPGAFFEADWGQGRQRVKVLRSAVSPGDGLPGTVQDDGQDNGLAVACEGGAVRLLMVQRAGRGPMTEAEFQRGAGIRPGMVLG